MIKNQSVVPTVTGSLERLIMSQ